jgi:hypothetical protein
MKKQILIISFVMLLTSIVSAQASLTIENNSKRSMTVKVMQGYSGKGTLHETVTIAAYSNETVYFSNSGYYFTKTKAVLQGKSPVYRKGQAFEVTNDATGYSVLTLTFSIKESSVPQATGGKQISKSEFDQN